MADQRPRPHLRLVTPEETEERERLLSHPAFDGVWGHEQFAIESLEAYVRAWEQHTERGIAWMAEQRRLGQQDPGDH